MMARWQVLRELAIETSWSVYPMAGTGVRIAESIGLGRCQHRCAANHWRQSSTARRVLRVISSEMG